MFARRCRGGLRIIIEPHIYDRAVSLNFSCLPVSCKTIGRVLVLAALSGALAVHAEPGRSKAELEQLRRSIDALQQQLASEGAREKSVTGELERLERQLADLAGQRRTEMAELRRVKTDRAKLERRQHDLEKQRLEFHRDFIKLVRANYMLGQQSGLKLIPNQRDPAETARALSIFRYLSKARHRRIEEGGRLHRELAETRTALDRRQRELDGLLKRLAHNQEQLDAQRARRERSLAAIRENMRRQQRQVVLYRQRERELERLLARLRRQSISRQPAPPDPEGNAEPRKSVTSTPAEITLGGFKQYKGDLDAPVNGTITARFGQRKPESGLKWEGLMFEAAEGEEVVAIYPGQVVFSDWFRGYGQLLVLDHGDGYMSLYGHNRLLRADIGASVKAGEGIGEAGSTGGLSRPGLYFEIRHNGKPRDPLEWCRI